MNDVYFFGQKHKNTIWDGTPLLHINGWGYVKSLKLNKSWPNHDQFCSKIYDLWRETSNNSWVVGWLCAVLKLYLCMQVQVYAGRSIKRRWRCSEISPRDLFESAVFTWRPLQVRRRNQTVTLIIYGICDLNLLPFIHVLLYIQYCYLCYLNVLYFNKCCATSLRRTSLCLWTLYQARRMK